MLYLAKRGFENIAITCNDYLALEKWLAVNLDAQLEENILISTRESQNNTMLYLKTSARFKKILIPHSAGVILSTMFAAQDLPIVSEIKMLPQSIFINLGLTGGNTEAVVGKIANELNAQRIALGDVCSIDEKKAQL